MKQVYLAQNPVEAHWVVDLLAAEGIQAIVQGEDLWAVRGGVPVTYPSVWVLRDGDFDRARELALAYDRGQQAPREQVETWQCGECGEVLEGQFTECWRCGARRTTKDTKNTKGTKGTKDTKGHEEGIEDKS